MSEKELIQVIRDLYKLWNTNDSDEEIDFLLNIVIQKIGRGE